MSKKIESDITPIQSYIINGAAGFVLFTFNYLLVFLILCFAAKFNLFYHWIWNTIIILVNIFIARAWAKQGYNYAKTGGELGVNYIALFQIFGKLSEHSFRLTNGKFAIIPNLWKLSIMSFMIFFVGPETQDIEIIALTSDKIKMSLKIKVVYHKTIDRLYMWAGFKKGKDKDPNTGEYVDLYVLPNITDFLKNKCTPIINAMLFDETQGAKDGVAAFTEILNDIIAGINDLPGRQLAVEKWAIEFEDVIISSLQTHDGKLEEKLTQQRTEKAEQDAETIAVENMNARIQKIIADGGVDKKGNPKVSWREARNTYLVLTGKRKEYDVTGGGDYAKGMALRKEKDDDTTS